MGIAANLVPVTREDVQGWLDLWKATKPPPKGGKKKFLADQMDAKYGPGTADTMVDTTEHTSIADTELSVIDMTMNDLDSYG